MNIVFKNKGTLSLLDLTTMGDSVKRNDSTKIGTFDSGLKYALSILYRNNIKVDIYSGNSVYSLGSKVVHDEVTTKTKELMVINELRHYNSDDPTEFKHTTAFSPKPWMAIRELYSNCLDEDGEVEFIDNNTTWESPEDSTTIMIHDNELLTEIIDNWGNYFINREPLYKGQYNVNIYENKSDFLRLYKNKILIFEDVTVKAKYSYEYNSASIDEMRMLNNKSEFESRIGWAMCESRDFNFIRHFLDNIKDEVFELGIHYGSLSEEWVSLVNDTYLNCVKYDKEFKVYPALFEAFTEDHRFEVGVSKVSYSSPSYSWSKALVKPLESKISNKPGEIVISFAEKILNICAENNFEVKYPIIKSKIDNHTAISDTHKKCIYVTEKFTDENMWEIIKAQFRIDGNDDFDYVYKEYVKLLNK